MSGHRTAARGAAAAAALFCAALTVGASPVHAAPISGPTVEFSGGSVLSLLVCKSEPSVSRVSVPAESRITFVNRLGQAGMLVIDGEPTKRVGADQAVPVVFHHGPVSVAMTFECSVGVVEEFHSMSVAVTPRKEGVPDSVAAAGATGATGTTATPSTPTSSPTQRRPAPRTAGGADTDPGEVTDEDSAMVPPGTEPAVAATSPSAGAPAVAVEPIVPASAPARRGAGGLLALVATVCVVGVGIAAIRAIMAQRTSRTSFA